MKLKEGFESRIAIADLEEDVQTKILSRLFKVYGQTITAKNEPHLKMSLSDVYYDIESFKVEIDSRGISEVAEALEEDIEDVAKELEKILKLLPKGDVGKYESENFKPTRRIKMFEEFSVDELEGFFMEDDEDDEDEEDEDAKYSTVDDMPHGGMEVEGEAEALEEEEDDEPLA